MAGTDPRIIQVTIQNISEEESDLLAALMMDKDFEGFSLENGTFHAFVASDAFKPAVLSECLATLPGGHEFTSVPLEPKNWNEEWERQYEPVIIEGRCLIRAPFHPRVDGIEYDLVIEPKMSFGTAHHETTAMMIGWVLEETVEGFDVLDMGTGTGVLAILAALKNAGSIAAVDNDEWAWRNAHENCERNEVPQVEVILGGVEAIPERPFDLVLANINRNILLDQIPAYAERIRPDGRMILSGFYEADLEAISQKALQCGLRLAGKRSGNHWIAAKFTR